MEHDEFGGRVGVGVVGGFGVEGFAGSTLEEEECCCEGEEGADDEAGGWC